jgi:hypothetical protein
MIAQPSEAAAWFVTWLHPMSVMLAGGIPLLRGCVRMARRKNRVFTTPIAVHDAVSGLTLPSFVALILAPLIPGLMTHVSEHMLQLAGLIAVFHTMQELFRGHHEPTSMFGN